jgi:hypothetical protein
MQTIAHQETTILRAPEIFAETPALAVHDDPAVLFWAVLSMYP